MRSEIKANKQEAVLLTALGFVYFVSSMASGSLNIGKGVIRRIGCCLSLSSWRTTRMWLKDKTGG